MHVDVDGGRVRQILQTALCGCDHLFVKLDFHGRCTYSNTDVPHKELWIHRTFDFIVGLNDFGYFVG